jgi:hypothetical protein
MEKSLDFSIEEGRPNKEIKPIPEKGERKALLPLKKDIGCF